MIGADSTYLIAIAGDTSWQPRKSRSSPKYLSRRFETLLFKSNDRTLQVGHHVIAKRWKKAASDGSPEEFARVLIPDVVDSTISHLLGAIDQEVLRLSFTSSSGKPVDLTKVAYESGEMSGWYRGRGGWREKYSKERFIDDFS